MPEPISSSDLVLPNDSYAFVLDETKGHITTYVGPSKTQLAGTDKLVIYDEEEKRYRPVVDRRVAVQTIKVAPEGWYVILKNPTMDRKYPTPSSNTSLDISQLEIGRKIHIPGPVSLALWPGQMAKVVQGHHLRTNQYLIVRVYDAEAATNNWSKTIIQKTEVVAQPVESDTSLSDAKVSEIMTDIPAVVQPQVDSILSEKIDFAVGKLMIIKGTEVSFFIPPTGIEVVKDGNGAYIREAVTLERLFYCILLDESGRKRYIRGPAVVFPSPTEIFQTHNPNGKVTRKFRAIELNEISGIYVKVIAPYEENGNKYDEGQELFITGKEQSIYYRRDEHQIIRYGDREIHFATAVPKGEARYVMDRLNGNIDTVIGPAMLLPDPRYKVIIRRGIPLDLCKLLYPGNSDALAYNQKLLGLIGGPTDFVTDNQFADSCSHDDNLGGRFESRASYLSSDQTNMTYGSSISSMMNDTEQSRGIDAAAYKGVMRKKLSSSAAEDSGILSKSATYTQPRTVTLSGKYDGAVRIKIWTGYAIIVVDGLGSRKVIEGPATYNLGYDEYPEVITMSTGKPKTTDKLLRDIYLRTKNNKISDIVVVETKDLVKVSMKLSYCVNFVGKSQIWFNVENYVKFLCDHMRSRMKGFAQTISLSDFYADSVNHIRNVILQKTEENGKHPGFLFTENNMFISDVEVLAVTIEDRDIASIIGTSQNEVVSTTLTVARKSQMNKLKAQLAQLAEEDSAISAKQLDIEHAFAAKKLALSLQLAENKHEIYLHEISMRDIEQTADIETEAKHKKLQASASAEIDMFNIDSKLKVEAVKDDFTVSRQEKLALVSEATLEREKNEKTLSLEFKESDAKIDRETVKINSAAVAEQFQAVTPGLVEALQSNAQINMLRDVIPSAIPLSIVEGQSVNNVLQKLLGGTSVGKILNNMQPVQTPK